MAETTANPSRPLRRVAMISVHGCPLVTPGMRSAGGMSVYLRRVSPLLAAQGVCVDIFTRSHEAGGPDLLDIGPGVRVIHVAGGPAELPKEQVPPYLPEVLGGVRFHVDGEGVGYDAVHSHYWLSGWVGAQLAQHLGVPHVVTYHTIGLVKEAAYVASEPSERKVAEAGMAASANQILAFTKEEAETLRALYGFDQSCVHVAPGGVDLDMFRPVDAADARRRLGLPIGERTVLYVGRLDPFKGPDVLMRAMAGVPNARLLVVGGSDANDAGVGWLRDVAEEVGVQDRVTWRAAVPQEELRDYYAAADLLAVPSFHESFGLVALEAMACGTPVVAARAGGLQEVVVDGTTGSLIDGHEAGTYAACLNELLGDDDRRREMGQAAIRWAQGFGWEGAAAKMLSTYEFAVSQFGGRPVVVPCIPGRVA